MIMNTVDNVEILFKNGVLPFNPFTGLFNATQTSIGVLCILLSSTSLDDYSHEPHMRFQTVCLPKNHCYNFLSCGGANTWKYWSSLLCSTFVSSQYSQTYWKPSELKASPPLLGFPPDSFTGSHPVKQVSLSCKNLVDMAIWPVVFLPFFLMVAGTAL